MIGYLPFIQIPEAWDIKVCLVLWPLIVLIQIVGNVKVKDEVKYGTSSYRAIKTLVAGVFGFIAVGNLVGTAGTPAYRLGFTLIALVITTLDFIHVIRRNHSKIYLQGKTTLGIVNFEDKDDVQLTLSAAASIVRHQRMDDKEYASPESLEELLEAFQIPSGDDFAENLREQARERRERLATDKVFAADVEMLRKEMHG